MRIIQAAPTLASGDGVGNCIFSFDSILKEEGIDTVIYANRTVGDIDPDLFRDSAELAEEKADLMIYHLSYGNELNERVLSYDIKKVMVYHNITPPEFMKGYFPAVAKACEYGLNQVKALAGKYDGYICDSTFNKEQLVGFGYPEDRIDVLPILVPSYEGVREKRSIIKKYDDGMRNIISVGRIAPNKKIEDVIRSFFYYRTFYDPDSRLLLVGNYDSVNSKYYRELMTLVEDLGIEDRVVFTGFVTEEEKAAYFRVGHLYLCLSEHEGFCIPVVEAMRYSIPVVAYSEGAVPETLGKGGILLKDKSPEITAAVMNRVLRDVRLRDGIRKDQEKELERFERGVIKDKLMEIIRKYV
ncbi:MAG: glycosyltransferase family 4 protein [Lachnospiraceae bacterium]|nr:glycosyltransferase family 4 protein [Lachnospiraceae bacterium]